MYSRSTVALITLYLPLTAAGADYHVGDGQPFTSIGAVSWEALQPGDTVLIHWRPAAYREKWVINRSGTPAAPILIRGVPGPVGQLPVIDGNGATTRPQLDYWNEVRNVVKVGGASVPGETMPRYIVIENLDIRSGRPPYTFTSSDGAAMSYVNNAAAIQIERGEHITVRNCILHDCGNGFFVSSSDAYVSRDILVEGCYLYDNGNDGSIYEHNNYTAGISIVFQFNRFGPLRIGAGGNNLKDRSAGLVVRYNWIEGGNRQLDLVDAEDSAVIRGDPSYRETFVYGNVLIEPAGAGNRQITHYGGDSGAVATYRKGTLYFHHNTVVSTRSDRTTLWRLSTNDEQCDARNNIFYVSAPGNTLALLDSAGVLDLRRNWFKPGWVATFGTLTGEIHDDGTALTGTIPGFRDAGGQDYRLTAGVACIDAGIPLPAAALPGHAPIFAYVRHQRWAPRELSGKARDLGAYEWPPADLDGDGDVDGDDYALLAGCASRAGVPHADDLVCTQADLDADGDVDADDFGRFQRLYTGYWEPSSAPSCP